KAAAAAGDELVAAHIAQSIVRYDSYQKSAERMTQATSPAEIALDKRMDAVDAQAPRALLALDYLNNVGATLAETPRSYEARDEHITLDVARERDDCKLYAAQAAKREPAALAAYVAAATECRNLRDRVHDAQQAAVDAGGFHATARARASMVAEMLRTHPAVEATPAIPVANAAPYALHTLASVVAAVDPLRAPGQFPPAPGYATQIGRLTAARTRAESERLATARQEEQPSENLAASNTKVVTKPPPQAKHGTAPPTR
ncbi:hypothetical protein, partial [Falsiroseomonas sp. E2-1-a20]|uniref:hypothetical protein n=1 Tax=Falsiroseomonas sp. E2-1-a20 TaxID=3239300 RepID=UPI003F3F08E6